MRFDQAFLSGFNPAFHQGWGTANDRMREDRASARADELEQYARGREAAAIARADELEQYRRGRDSEQDRRMKERDAEMDRRAKEYEDRQKKLEAIAEKREQDAVAMRVEETARRVNAEKAARRDKAYQSALAVLPNTNPEDAVTALRPLWSKAGSGQELTPEEEGTLAAGKDAYGMMRRMASTPRTIEQTVKGQDPTDPTKELYQKVRIPDPTWKPVAMPSFEELMAGKTQAAPAVEELRSPPAPAPEGDKGPLQRSIAQDIKNREESAKRKAGTDAIAAAKAEEIRRGMPAPGYQYRGPAF